MSVVLSGLSCGAPTALPPALIDCDLLPTLPKSEVIALILMLSEDSTLLLTVARITGKINCGGLSRILLISPTNSGVKFSLSTMGPSFNASVLFVTLYQPVFEGIPLAPLLSCHETLPLSKRGIIFNASLLSVILGCFLTSVSWSKIKVSVVLENCTAFPVSLLLSSSS